MDKSINFNPRAVRYAPGSTLPQWRQDDAIYFVTYRLADSLPKEILDDWDMKRRIWLMQALPLELVRNLAPNLQDPLSLKLDDALAALSDPQKREYHRIFTSRWHGFLDTGYGACLLREQKIRTIVTESLLHFDGSRYQLSTSVIMPNHVHVLVRPSSHELTRIIHTWKSYTAHEINRVLNQKGPVWMRESYNRIVRSPQSLEKYHAYVINNPAKAGLSSNDYSLIKAAKQ